MSTPAADAHKGRAMLGLLLLSAAVGVVVSLAAWCFLQAIHALQHVLLTSLPDALGYDSTPLWWWVPILAVAGVVTALAIVRLPGTGGHIPAFGLTTSPTQPVELPGVLLAALASIGLGVVLGPEAPLIAMGGALGALSIRLAGGGPSAEVRAVVAAAGSFAALSMIFQSPVIAAVILVEASGIAGERLSLVLLPGLLAAGIGSLVSIGMGSFTGLSTSDYAIGPLSLPSFTTPTAVDFLWTIALAVAVALVVAGIFAVARAALRTAADRPYVALPVTGVVIAALAIVFDQATGQDATQVLFSGQDALPDLVSQGPGWSAWTLVALIACKGLAWGVSLGKFRGGPVFPALFLGAAAGLLAAHVPGLDATPAVAAGMGAAVVSVLRLPLSSVVLAELLTSHTGAGSGPLIIVAVVVAFLVTTVVAPAKKPADAAGDPAPQPA